MLTQEGITNDIWECVDNHGNCFTINSLTAIGQHVIAFWLLEKSTPDTTNKQNNDTKGETNYEHAQGSTK